MTGFAPPAAGDYEGPDGYGATTTHELDVSHDGYPGDGEAGEAPDPTTYVVIEAEDGATERVDGETVIVVQEPEPLAATAEAPPPHQTVQGSETEAPGRQRSPQHRQEDAR